MIVGHIRQEISLEHHQNLSLLHLSDRGKIRSFYCITGCSLSIVASMITLVLFGFGSSVLLKGVGLAMLLLPTCFLLGVVHHYLSGATPPGALKKMPIYGAALLAIFLDLNGLTRILGITAPLQLLGDNGAIVTFNATKTGLLEIACGVIFFWTATMFSSLFVERRPENFVEPQVYRQPAGMTAGHS